VPDPVPAKPVGEPSTPVAAIGVSQVAEAEAAATPARMNLTTLKRSRQTHHIETPKQILYQYIYITLLS
jgi:hypothetical protein